MRVLQVNVVMNGVLVADAGQFPPGLDGMSVGIQLVAGECVGDNDRRAAVDLIAELHQILGNDIVVIQLGLNDVGA